MQDTRLQTIAQAVSKRQERYQRHTCLFDQLARLLVQERPVAPELLVRLLHRTLFAWCAFDTLAYPVELHLFAQVTSRCPVTGSSIHLTVTPEQVRDLDPGEAQVSLVVDVAAGCCSNVREDVCNYGHFFASREAALLWQVAHPHALILSVEEAYQVGKLVKGSRCRDGES
jgi:hypothetical protein